jgi:hypothetical protein
MKQTERQPAWARSVADDTPLFADARMALIADLAAHF